jgi:hypothetical protein
MGSMIDGRGSLDDSPCGRTYEWATCTRGVSLPAKIKRDEVKATLKDLLQALSWILFVIAAGAFWIGGRAIHEFAGVDRTTAELAGISLAAVCGGLGVFLKNHR